MANESKDLNIEEALAIVLGEGEIEFAHDQYSDAIAIINDKGKRRAMPIASRKFRRWIERALYKVCRKPSSRGHVDSIIDVCSARGLFDGVKHHLEPRITHVGKVIYYDLGPKVVRIDSTGWEIIDNAPVMFREYEIMKPQVLPMSGGNLDWLLDLFNIREPNDRIILKAWIVSAFVPWIAHPINATYGQQGSAKTTLTRLLIDLIDPNHVPDIHLSDIPSLLQGADHRWVLPLDNVSYITSEMSDLLCKIVTGTGIQKRALYTNDDDFFRSLRRIVIVNGLTAVPEKSDLLDRTILISLDVIPKSKRRLEEDVLKQFDEQKPLLLGACLDHLSRSLRIVETLKLAELPRMADFALWGAAISESMGGTASDFTRAYASNVDRQIEETFDSSPVGTIILFYLKSHKSLSGVISEVFKIVLDNADAAGVDRRALPRNAKSFGKSLVEITPGLTAMGYVVNRTRNQSRTIEILAPMGRYLDSAREVFEKQMTSFTSSTSLNQNKKSPDDPSPSGGAS